MTEKLLQMLFANLDPHKKGFLTSNDWKYNFGKISTIINEFTFKNLKINIKYDN